MIIKRDLTILPLLLVCRFEYVKAFHRNVFVITIPNNVAPTPLVQVLPKQYIGKRNRQMIPLNSLPTNSNSNNEQEIVYIDELNEDDESSKEILDELEGSQPTDLMVMKDVRI
jgi:hypothetical protein